MTTFSSLGFKSLQCTQRPVGGDEALPLSEHELHPSFFALVRGSPSLQAWTRIDQSRYSSYVTSAGPLLTRIRLQYPGHVKMRMRSSDIMEFRWKRTHHYVTHETTQLVKTSSSDLSQIMKYSGRVENPWSTMLVYAILKNQPSADATSVLCLSARCDERRGWHLRMANEAGSGYPPFEKQSIMST